MSSNIQHINQSTLRSLTYLELCVVPAFIKPYLSTLSHQKYIASFFLFIQTFAETNPDFPKVNITSNMLSECKRPIGQQLIYLLKLMLEYGLQNQQLSVGLFFGYDNSIQIWMIEFTKALLEDLNLQDKYKILKKCLSLTIGLSIDLCEIKRGNSKYFLTHSQKNQSFDLQMQAQSQYQKKYQQLNSITAGFNKEFFSQNIEHYHLYRQCIEIQSAYNFTIIEKTERQNQQKIDEQNDEINPIALSDELCKIQEENISNFDLWYQLLEIQSFDMACIAYLNILRNYRQIDLSKIIRLKNSLIILTKRVAQNRQDEILIRTSYYSLLSAIKLLINLKQQKNEEEVLEESENLFKEIISIQTCTIKSTYLFLSAFLQANIANKHSYIRISSLIGWIMNHYRKYNFKSQQMIYADFIASSLDILLLWKQYNKQSEDQKQIQTILTKLTNKVNDHSVNNFSVFFQTLNPTLLEFITDILFRVRKSYDQIIAELSEGNPVSNLLNKLGNSFKRFFSSFTSEEMKEKSKSIENSENKLSFIYSIQKNRCQSKRQKTILIKIYQIIKTIGQNDSAVMNDSQIQALTKPCILQLTEHYLLNINYLLAEYIISSSKKNQATTNSVNVNADLKVSKQFIEEALPVYLILNFMLFLSNPSKNQKNLIFTIVLDSFTLEQRCIEPILSLLRKSKFQHYVKWREQYSQIFKCTRRFDALQLFDEQIISNMRQTRPQIQFSNVREADDDQISLMIASFQKFCRDWCREQQNYQWFSEQKQSRIRLLSLKNLCTKVKEWLSY